VCQLRAAHGSQSLLNTLIDREYYRRLQAQNWAKYRLYYYYSDENDYYQEDKNLCDY
jgi:hypothetical protein